MLQLGPRVSGWLGVAVAAMLAVSAAAHGVLGWPALQAELAAAAVSADLVAGLRVGWLFGSVCMVAFSAILVRLFLARLRGRAESIWPAQVVGVIYVTFGAWAMFADGFNPFFLVFVVPGVLLLVAAPPSLA